MSQPSDPAVVLDLLTAFRASKVMFTAVSLGVFDALAAGPMDVISLADEVKAHRGALTRLLDACVGLGLLAREGEKYANTPAADDYLTSESPRRLTGYINYSNQFMWRLWDKLEDAVRDGSHRWRQVFGWDGPIFSNFFRNESAKREFLMGMHGFGVISSPAVASAFDLSRFRQLVDLGGATGHLAIAACERYPQLQAIVFDLDAVEIVAEEMVKASPVAKRIHVVSGDFFVDELPAGDLYALGRILHDWSEEKILKLLKRIYERLPHGGALLVAEKLLLDDHTGPRWAQLQDLNMLTCTEGRERTLGEYESLLKKVGFGKVEGRRTTTPLDAVLAIKEA